MTETSVNSLRPFYAMEILARAKALEAEGRDICHLEVGEPAVPPAPEVRNAVRDVLDLPQKYTHAKGNAELRQALSDYYAGQHACAVDPERIMVTMGSSAGFILAFLAGFKPGARIAVTRPGYPAYLNILAGLGFEPVEIALDPVDGWHLSAAAVQQAYKSNRFDGLLFASPANPTGAAVDAANLERLVATCARLGVRFISDEIYHGLDHVRTSASAAEFDKRAIIVNSFSKYYCMTGWRVGWLVLPDELVRKAEILQQNLFISAPSLSQVAGQAALKTRAYSEVQKAGYARNRELLGSGLAQLGFKGAIGEGAFYAYLDVSDFTDDSLHFCGDLLEHAGVAATPGLDFDRVNGHKYVRFSYAGSPATVERALERIEAFLKK